jgi:hypothetical protein
LIVPTQRQLNRTDRLFWKNAVVAVKPLEQSGQDQLFVDEDPDPREEEKRRNGNDQVEPAEEAARHRTVTHFWENRRPALSADGSDESGGDTDAEAGAEADAETRIFPGTTGDVADDEDNVQDSE